ncbi:MAG: Cif family virulence factor [Planctomycetota bacterium]|jgi:ketosteroid isomerase-like protein
MPDPPQVGLLTRYLLENPYPLGGVLLLVAIVAAWTGLRDGLRGRLGVAALLGLLAAAVLIVGTLVVTAGEHGERVTRDFVDAVVAEDLVGADNLLTDDAAIAFGSPQNPGLGKEAIRDRLSDVARGWDITSNRCSVLRGYGTAADEAEVHLTCWTEVDGDYGPTVTQWVLRARRQDDGEWRIRRLAWISVNGRPVTGTGLR